MKPIFLILLTVMLSACMKEHPLKALNNDLTGVWLADNKIQMLLIDNTDGKGDGVTYTEASTGNVRFLYQHMDGKTFKYKVERITDTDMNLIDTVSVNTHFKRLQ